MSDENKDSKSEAPTEKKITDTIEKGNVPFSKEVTNAASLLGILFVGFMFLQTAVMELNTALGSLFANQRNWPLDTPEDAALLLSVLQKNIASTLLPVIIPIMIFGLISSLTQNKPSLMMNRISPKLSKISIPKGLKRLFGKQGFREFSKALFKFSAAGIVVAFIVYLQTDTVISQIYIDSEKIPTSIYLIFLKVVTGLTLLIFILAIADYVWTKRDWVDDLKMSHQEIKDERKQSEGDPIYKSRNRSIARDRSRRRMVNDVKNATFVVANPTHFAIALRYEPAKDKAPFVLAKGQDLIALKIREVAEENAVPVTEDRQLARAMYKFAQINAVVPPEFFIPLASIIRTLNNQQTASVQ